MQFETWLAFVAVWSVAMVGIGTNVLICISAGATNGFVRGVWIALGLTLASAVHVMFAGLGLSVVILAWAGAFALLKWCGVIYLAYLGVQLWKRRAIPEIKNTLGQEGRYELFRRGFVICLTNPQAYVWYIVFLIPFVDAGGRLTPQVITLALTVMGVNVIAYSAYVIMGTPMRRFLTTEFRVRVFNRVSAAILFALAVLLAVSPTQQFRR